MDQHMHHNQDTNIPSKLTAYTPLLFVLLGIMSATAITMTLLGDTSLHAAMRLFMGYFFAAFAFFKFLDLRGFANAYAEYDLIAKRSRRYALAYPFIEAALALAYLFAWNLAITNSITAIVMGISAVGVFQALRNKEQIRCACLGAVVKLPMTTVTLIEDVGMAAMAIAMLVI